ncbi:MAG: hypothetical protein R3F20_19450 [Planctomycetota bacterium]
MKNLARLALVLLPLLVSGAVAPSTISPPDRQEPVPHAPRMVKRAELAELAARTRADVQMKLTWCGEQTNSIPTLVLGSRGHGMGLAKYEGLRLARWHYGNDTPEVTVFLQLAPETWTRILAALRVDEIETAANPDPERARERPEAHDLVFSWFSPIARDLRCLRFVGRKDAVRVLDVVRGALDEKDAVEAWAIRAIDMHRRL